MRHPLLSTCLAAAIVWSTAAAGDPTIDSTTRAQIKGSAPPRIHPEDPLRFEWNGETWFPLGFYGGVLNQVHGLDPWGGDPEAAHNAFMAKLAAEGLNYFRTWINWGAITQHNDDGSWDYHQIHPYNRVASCGPSPLPACASDGNPPFDLDSFNLDYFELIERGVQTAASHGIVAQIILLDCWHVKHPPGDRHDNIGEDYYHGLNNVNRADARTGDEWTAGNPEHPTPRIARVAQEQRDFVNKVLDYLGDEPNVIFETCNEVERAESPLPPLPSPIHDFIYGVVRKRTDHLVMPIDLPEHRDVAGSKTPGCNGGQSIEEMHRVLIDQRSLGQPLISDNDCGEPEIDPNISRKKAWAALTAGAHTNYFLDNVNVYEALMTSPEVGLGMRQFGFVLNALDELEIDLAGMQSADNLVSAGDWASARPGEEFLVYLPAGSPSTTTVQQLPTFRTARWIDPRTGAISVAERGPTFSQAGSNDWALHVRKEATTIPGSAFIADSFSLAAPDREVGDALNGTTTELGDRTWTAVTGFGMGHGHVTNLGQAGSLVAGVAFGPSDFTQRVATVQAVVDASQSEWAGVGFSKSATGNYWSEAQVWVFLGPTGSLGVRANGLAHVIHDETRAAWSGGRHRLELAYDRIGHTVRVWVDGVELSLTNSDLDTFGFTPNILHTGFHAQGGSGSFPAAGRAVIDDFAVSLSGDSVHDLIASFIPSPGSARVETPVSTPSSPLITFHYDESLGNFEQRIGGACHDSYENPSYFKVRYSGDTFDSCTFRGDFDAGPITCTPAHVSALLAGAEVTIATDDYQLDASTCRRINPLVPRVLPNTNHWLELNVTKAGVTTTRRVNFRKTSPNPSPPYMRLIAHYRTSATSGQEQMISSLPNPPSFGYFYKQSTGSFEQRLAGPCNNGADNPTYLRVSYEGTSFDSCTFQTSVDAGPFQCPAWLVAELQAGVVAVLNTDEFQSENIGICPPQFSSIPRMRQGEPHWLELRFTKAGQTTTRRLNFSRTNPQQ